MTEVPEFSPTSLARVRLIATSSLGGEVQDLKLASASLITLLERVQAQHPECAREAAVAITHVQTACMFGVFACTAPLVAP